MSGKPVVLRERAGRDVDEAVERYRSEAGSAVALDFINALAEARLQISEQPGICSLRYARQLNIPDLRFWTAGKFPYLIFYFEGEAEIDVWRVLHGARDIPAWMRASVGD